MRPSGHRQRLRHRPRRDAVAMSPTNLYKRNSACRRTFSANMLLALVDGVPAPCRSTASSAGSNSPDRRHRAPHGSASAHLERLHILEGYLKALTPRRGHRPHPPLPHGRRGPRRPHVSPDRTPFRPTPSWPSSCAALAALERQKIMHETPEPALRRDDLNDILAKPERQRAIISAESRRDRRRSATSA